MLQHSKFTAGILIFIISQGNEGCGMIDNKGGNPLLSGKELAFITNVSKTWR